jgi:carbamoyl-phosphate synthase large subunit
VALAACQAIGLRGPADVDVRRRADGTPVVLEINARFGANLTHAPEVLDALLADVGWI